MSGKTRALNIYSNLKIHRLGVRQHELSEKLKCDDGCEKSFKNITLHVKLIKVI